MVRLVINSLSYQDYYKSCKFIKNLSFHFTDKRKISYISKRLYTSYRIKYKMTFKTLPFLFGLICTALPCIVGDNLFRIAINRDPDIYHIHQRT
jgi:hypothetical protein